MIFYQNKKIVVLLVFLVFLGLFVYLLANKSHQIVVLDGKEFVVDVARSPKDLKRGLSGRQSLLPGTGLLFVFDKPGDYGFWMKEMNFSIDIIWISNENKIIHIEKSLTPDTFPKIYYPNGLASFVLEISDGESKLLDLKIGDSVKFLKK